MSKIVSLVSGLFSGGTSILASIGIYALVLLAGLTAGGYVGYHFEASAAQRAQIAALEAAQTKYDALARQQQTASQDYERRLAAATAQARVVTQTVQKIVERPVYRNMCLDADGLKAVDEALTGK